VTTIVTLLVNASLLIVAEVAGAFGKRLEVTFRCFKASGSFD
jgi:hypothetical protein